MDDTTWLSKGKTEIEKQLDIANKFNRYNGIKVNPEKSQLIIVNSSEKDEDNYVKYGKNTTIIKPLKKGDSTRFLGVWISDKNNKNFVKKQIQKDVQTIYNLTRGKLVTAEQMAYVLNAVAIPRIEYKAHLTIFNELEAKSLTAKLRTCLHNKIGIANTAPNVLLNRKELYNLIDFFDRQIEAQTSNLILKLNDKGALGITTEIRLRQLQTKEWLNDNPLHVWNYNNVNMFKGNIIAQILCLIGDLGLSIYFLHDNTFKIEGGSVPIIDILKDDYRKNINSLKKKNIIYLEQLAYEGNKFFKEWMNISHHPDVYYKGKIPNWWKSIKETVTQDGKTNKIKEEYEDSMKTNNNFFNQRLIYPTPIDGRTTNWIGGYLEKDDKQYIVFEKLIENKNEVRHNNLITIEHYWENNKSHGNLCLAACTSCPTKNCLLGNKDPGKCIITINKSNCLLIRGRIEKIGPNGLQTRIIQNKEALKNEILYLNDIENHSLNHMIINDWIDITDKIERIHLIKKLFTDNIKRNELIELYKENYDNELLNADSVAHYYTDRSARKLGNFTQLAMAWIRIENNNAIINQFKAANFGWPSSTKIELMAIYTAVVVTEKNKEIIVYTDSLSAINQIDSYKKELSNRRKMKLHHHIILEAMF